MVITTMMAMSGILSLLQVGLLLCLPIPLHWLSLLLLYSCLNITTFWQLSSRDKFLHLLANSWVAFPVRRGEERQQVHKAREQVFSLVLGAANLVITAVVTITLMIAAIPQNQQQDGFLVDFLIIGLPPVLLHLAGAGLLLLFYKTCHPWRGLGRERERRCWGKLQGTRRGEQEEIPYWEQVR